MSSVFRPLALSSFGIFSVNHLRQVPFSLIRLNVSKLTSQLFSRVEEPLKRLFPILSDPESLAAALWIIGTTSERCYLCRIGEFGDEIDEAPYLLEKFIANQGVGRVDLFAKKGDGKQKCRFHPQRTVLMELLIACVKLFISRSPEMQRSLGKLFNSVRLSSQSQFLSDSQ